MFHRVRTLARAALLGAWACAGWVGWPAGEPTDPLRAGFSTPPDAARPWVYWFWMDGNISREGITADLEAMQRAGIGGVILMEVDVGIPRGPVAFMSDAWRALFKHAVLEAERLGLDITLNAGPGWTGSGGPWVKPDESMQHLVASATEVEGPADFDATLPQPPPRDPHFVHAPIPASLKAIRDGFYRDVAVLAFPTPPAERTSASSVSDLGRASLPASRAETEGTAARQQPRPTGMDEGTAARQEPRPTGLRLMESDEKALYYRNPYSSPPAVKPYLPAPAEYASSPAGGAIEPSRMVDLTGRMDGDGRLRWNVPAGHWTIMRFGRTSTGANTRPAPAPGIGLESDKFSRAALEAHFDKFVGGLLREIGPRPAERSSGWKMLHMDSWEMGAQNWTPRFREEFQQRRGYDPRWYLPAFTGRVVGSLELSERFLWDVRQTAQELVIENHARHLRTLGRRHGLGLSIEPYDMNPCSDLSLGGEADVPMCEFWADGFGFNTVFSCVEAVSIAHTLGRPVVAAEAFTADAPEAWQLHPGAMKPQADWAFAFGINRLVVHRYAHQPWLDRWPGMTMGPYGVHYERTQTWWDLADAWHTYLARCQFMLRRGLPVADICYLAAEGAPHVFRPPASALHGAQPVPDRRGYNFDGCAPETVLNLMSVNDGRLVLPGGMSYRVLVLPEVETMTPALLRKVSNLVKGGATVIGRRPLKSPSLSGYPGCDVEVKRLADELWGTSTVAATVSERSVGQGRVIAPARTPARPESRPPDLTPDARWIWHDEGNPASAAPVATRHFRRTFVCPADRRVVSAQLAMTADNSFEAALNGQVAGSGANFRELFGFELRSLLRPGENLLTVRADNGGERPNPAGLIGVLELRFEDGGVMRLPTDAAWTSSLVSTGGVQGVKELGPPGMAPWGDVGAPGAKEPPPLYGPYEAVADVLATAGVRPDFEAVEALRYAHRRDGDTDLYFVANRAATPVVADCTFRVEGRQPEWWDPTTGETRPLAAYRFDAGRTIVPLEFEPHGSGFIVFQQPVTEPRTWPSAPLTAAMNFPSSRAVLDLRGPWQVSFQTDRGAPETLAFDALTDWTAHPDERVRHFSGLATYRTKFALDAVVAEAPAGNDGYLDLGEVRVMARVRLNGTDLGVAWGSPYRLAVRDALKAGENTLEVTVANLWPNRLIGDQALPAADRVSWTTWNPYKPDSRLLPSGLLGPVTLRERVHASAANP